MLKQILDIFYALIGVLMLLAGIESLRDKASKTHIGTGIFWLILAAIFLIGNYLPNEIIGILIVIIGLLSLFKQVKVGNLAQIDTKIAETAAKKYRGWIFLPSIILALSSILIAQFTKLGGQIAIGIASVLALLSAVVLTKEKPKDTYHDSARMIQALGTAGILPQLLSMLGVMFTASGVGVLISKTISHVFPTGNHLLGVALYCLAMFIFTAIMGNAFAAFSVITAGIGIPFVIAQGANPVVVAAIGMTAGYCGTLITPMAANFNALPVALMDMTDELGVIKQQAPIAIILLIVQIGLMYLLAF